MDSQSLSQPGPSWRMLWPNGGLDNLQLDVVGFLAILGEDAVKKTSRLASLSWTFCLPRLLPAPHSLLFSERPEEHDNFRAKVVGAQSGNLRDHLTHVAGALFGHMETFTVRCCEISERPYRPPPNKPHGLRRESPPRPRASNLRATWKGPVVAVNLFGCALSVALLVLSLVFGDGMSLVATLLLSALSTLVGITNHWQFSLRRRDVMMPSTDTVIFWPNASFLVVRCTENLARELFWAPERINYTLNWTNGFMILSLFGTVFLMISVIALANARIELQLAWAAAYVILNIAHWVAAALPRKYNWDFSAFHIKEQSIDGGPKNSTFTEALWKAIVLTRSVRWIKKADLVPEAEEWQQWQLEAEEKADTGGSHVGPLINPIWGGDDPADGIIWDVPKDWSAQEALMRIRDERLAFPVPAPDAQDV